jgi:hypothetical protein
MPRKTPPTRLLAAAVLAGAALMLGSCNIVAPIGYVIHGPEKIPAQYTLDPKKVTVVFIDDSAGSVLPSRAVRRKIGESAENTLLNEAKIEKMIASQDVMTVVDREKYSKQMTLVELGEAVGADVVIVATMLSYSLTQDNENYTPIASASVRVVDIKEKQQIWPVQLERSHVMEVKSPPRAAGGPISTADRNKLQLAFAERIGREVGYLFVAHTPVPEAGLLDH